MPINLQMQIERATFWKNTLMKLTQEEMQNVSVHVVSQKLNQPHVSYCCSLLRHMQTRSPSLVGFTGNFCPQERDNFTVIIIS